MKKIGYLAAALFAVSSVQGAIIDDQFTNLDFDSGVYMTTDFTGFDTAQDIAGWVNQGDVASLNDAGVQSATAPSGGTAAWWGSYDDNSAFMSGGDGAYNQSTHTIGSSEWYRVSFQAKGWSLADKGWGSDSDATVTATLFYGGDTSNVIISYTTKILPNTNDSSAYELFSSSYAEATGAAIGQDIGVLIESSSAGYVTFDEVSVDVVPEPATVGLMGVAGLGMFLARRKARR